MRLTRVKFEMAKLFVNIFLVLTIALIVQSFPTNEVDDSSKIIIKENTLENSKKNIK